MKVYLAGPLFTMAERWWNAKLANALNHRGLDVFLPQRDCEDFVRSPEGKGCLSVEEAIYLGCRRGVDSSDFVLANYDGSDADAGTAWEAGYAFGQEKAVFWYRTDFRTSADSKKGVNLMLLHSGTKLDLGEVGPNSVIFPELVAEALLDTIRAGFGQAVS